MNFVVVVTHSLIWVWREELAVYVVIVHAERNGEEDALTTRSVDNSIVWLPGLGRAASMRWWRHHPEQGKIMAKRKAEPNCEERTQLNAVRHAR